MPRSGIAGAHADLDFLRNLRAAVHNGYICIPTNQQRAIFNTSVYTRT